MVFVLNNFIQKKKKKQFSFCSDIFGNVVSSSLFLFFIISMFAFGFRLMVYIYRRIYYEKKKIIYIYIYRFGNVVSSRLIFYYYFNVCIWIQFSLGHCSCL